MLLQEKEATNDLPILVGKNIRKAREDAGLTQEELSSQTALSRVTINQIENGVRKQVKAENIQKISRVLGKTETYFYSNLESHDMKVFLYQLPKPLGDVMEHILSLPSSEQEKLGQIIQQILKWRHVGQDEMVAK